MFTRMFLVVISDQFGRKFIIQKWILIPSWWLPPLLLLLLLLLLLGETV